LAAEDIKGVFVGVTQPNQPPTIFPLLQGYGDLDLATAHGSFTLPDAWGAVAGSARLQLVGITPKASSCSASCTENPTAADTAWSATESTCGYDGKLVASFGVSAPPPACRTALATVATWRWR
jgi:hypothetical protein